MGSDWRDLSPGGGALSPAGRDLSPDVSFKRSGVLLWGREPCCLFFGEESVLVGSDVGDESDLGDDAGILHSDV